MLVKFLFILTMSGQAQIADHDLTWDDCLDAMLDYADGHPNFDQGTPSCEFQGFTYLAVTGKP